MKKLTGLVMVIALAATAQQPPDPTRPLHLPGQVDTGKPMPAGQPGVSPGGRPLAPGQPGPVGQPGQGQPGQGQPGPTGGQPGTGQPSFVGPVLPGPTQPGVVVPPKKEEPPKGTYSRAGLRDELNNLADCLLRDKNDRRADIDTSAMSPLEKSILDDVTDGREPKWADVTNAWISATVRRHNAIKKTNLTEDEVRKALRSALMNSSAGEWGKLKAQLTERSARRLGKKQFVNNDDSDSPLDVLFEGKSQPAGFTVMLLIAARQAWGDLNYRSERPVVIFTSGHMLPGIVRRDRGKDMLIGLETSVDGEGRRNFGPMEDLPFLDEPVRVVDSETFALLDLFGDKLPLSVRNCMSEKAVKNAGMLFRYESGVEKIEKVIFEAQMAHEKTGDRSAPTVAKNSGIGNGLAFGRPPVAVAVGDVARTRTDSAGDVVKKPVGGDTFVIPPRVGPVLTVDDLILARFRLVLTDTLRALNNDELKAKVAELERESLAAWKTNKEAFNREEGSALRSFEQYKLSIPATEALHKYINTRTTGLVPPAAKAASAQVFEANKILESVTVRTLTDYDGRRRAALYAAVKDGSKAASAVTGPTRDAELTAAIRGVLERSLIEADKINVLLPAFKDVELKRFDADKLWEPVLTAPKKDPAKKDGPATTPAPVPAPMPMNPMPMGPAGTPMVPGGAAPIPGKGPAAPPPAAAPGGAPGNGGPVPPPAAPGAVPKKP